MADKIPTIWSVYAPEQGPPPAIARLGLSLHSEREGPRKPDPDALAMIQGAGIHLDQQVVSLDGEREVVLTGDVALDDLAEAVVSFVQPEGEEPIRALAVDMRARPMRLTEVGVVTSPVLVVESDEHGARQVPPQRDTVLDALRSGVAHPEPRRGASS